MRGDSESRCSFYAPLLLRTDQGCTLVARDVPLTIGREESAQGEGEDGCLQIHASASGRWRFPRRFPRSTSRGIPSSSAFHDDTRVFPHRHTPTTAVTHTTHPPLLREKKNTLTKPTTLPFSNGSDTGRPTAPASFSREPSCAPGSRGLCLGLRSEYVRKTRPRILAQAPAAAGQERATSAGGSRRSRAELLAPPVVADDARKGGCVP